MPAYVRLKNHGQLRARIAATGLTQAEVAAATDLSVQRISQLATGVSQVIRAEFAEKLEDVLGAHRGELFRAEEPDRIRPYLGEPSGPDVDPSPDPSPDPDTRQSTVE